MEIKFFKTGNSEVNFDGTLGTATMSVTEISITGDLDWLAPGDQFR